MTTGLKLNLGCGNNHYEGYLNVDKYANPEFKCDLEVFPWPWEDNSVEEIVLNHVLEHLGETTASFINIMKELYRVCKPGALIRVNVPHPRHNNFTGDPTHVRVITPQLLALFSKENNYAFIRNKSAASTLALYHDVDFEVIESNYQIDNPWATQFNNGEITHDELLKLIDRYNNVANSINMVLKVIK